MASFFSHLNPIPTFSAYTGPYKVGTQEIEIPVSDLSSPSPAPDTSIFTVSFRVFYPCEPVKAPKPVYWLPNPQGEYFRAYARFLNASHRLASFLSYLPLFRTIFYTTIPALKDAKLAAPPKDAEKWPVMIFSHGLGGSKNAYSQITGSIASHGMVVIAPEHRDGSAPISYIRSRDGSSSKAVQYLSLPHKPSPEVEESRNEQLKIRLWELGLIHAGLLKIADGKRISNLAAEAHHDIFDTGFASLLDVHTPGKISWAGHSFGASTVIQFVKSVYYPPTNGHQPLYAPSLNSPISAQITPASPITLLDLWAFPLLCSSTSWLWEKPLPAHQSAEGSPPLLILGESFFKWKSNLRDTKHAISPPAGHATKVNPYIFYPVGSVHLSQSDFAPLFPWLTRKIFKAEDPDRMLRLNVRAILENLRRSGVAVAETSPADMEIIGVDTSGSKQLEERQAFPLGQDCKILATDGSVQGWIAIPLDDDNDSEGTDGHTIEANNLSEAVIDGEVKDD